MPKRSRDPPIRLSWGGGDHISSRLETRIAPARTRPPPDLWTDYYAPTDIKDLSVAPKKVQQVKEWIESDQNGGMLILVGSPGIGRSTMVKLLCAGKIHEWMEEPGCEYPLESFERFLQQSIYLSPGTVVLLDDIPNLHTDDQKERFRNSLGNHVLRHGRKTIWVYSQTHGGQHVPRDLEALLDPSVLYYSGEVTIMQIHAVTDSRMKKILGKVCKEHKIVLPDVSSFHGDLRHALLTLQFSASRLSDRRDEPLSAFHALGKLLYAKRKESPTYDGNEANRRPPLQFVPEEVIQNSSMSLYASLHFLHYHAPDFFTDSIELSRAFDLYSDAAVLMDCSLDSYATSVVSRAAANENVSKAPNKFRSLSSPAFFEVQRKAKVNRTELQLLHNALSGSNLSNFIIDHYPYMRRISPHQVSTLNLQSFLGQGGHESFARSREEEEARRLREEQATILALDDIEDFSSDEEKGKNGSHH